MSKASKDHKDLNCRAARLMGFTVVKKAPWPPYLELDGKPTGRSCPDYCRSVDASKELDEFALKKGFFVIIQRTFTGWSVSYTNTSGKFIGYDFTADDEAEARTRAFISLAGKIKDE